MRKMTAEEVAAVREVVTETVAKLRGVMEILVPNGDTYRAYAGQVAALEGAVEAMGVAA